MAEFFAQIWRFFQIPIHIQGITLTGANVFFGIIVVLVSIAIFRRIFQ